MNNYYFCAILSIKIRSNLNIKKKTNLESQIIILESHNNNKIIEIS